MNNAAAFAFRNEVAKYLLEQRNAKRLRTTVALANLWLNTKGQDDEILKIAQSALDLQKIEAKAVQIAAAALAPAKAYMASGHYWDAKSEIDKATALIASRVQDRTTLEFIQLEMAATDDEDAADIRAAMRKRDVVFQQAARDTVERLKGFSNFTQHYPDYPDTDQDKLKLSDLRSQQIEQKYARRIAEIEEVIPNDQAEARAMIKRLIDGSADEDEVSVLRSKVVKLNREILDHEIASIQSDMDEAQSYGTTGIALVDVYEAP